MAAFSQYGVLELINFCLIQTRFYIPIQVFANTPCTEKIIKTTIAEFLRIWKLLAKNRCAMRIVKNPDLHTISGSVVV